MMAMVAHSPQVNALVVTLIDHPYYYFTDDIFAQANYDYEAKSEKEISFNNGDIIRVCSAETGSLFDNLKITIGY